MRSAILLFITVAALQTGYLVGHNQGFETGKVIGAIDAKFHILHNGKAE